MKWSKVVIVLKPYWDKCFCQTHPMATDLSETWVSLIGSEKAWTAS